MRSFNLLSGILIFSALLALCLAKPAVETRTALEPETNRVGEPAEDPETKTEEEPHSTQSVEPVTKPAEEPETTPVGEPQAIQAVESDKNIAEEPETTPMGEPQAIQAVESDKKSAEEPEKTPAAVPQLVQAVEPETKPADEPDTTPAVELETTTAGTESIDETTSDTTSAAEPKANQTGTGSYTIDESFNKITDEQTEFLKSYADQMLSYMNLTVAPCDDFYEYACGNWKLVKPERQSQHKRSNLLDILYTLIDKTEQLLLSNSSLARDLGYENELKVAQQFYGACLSADLYPMPAADPAYLALIRSIGGFPAVDGDAWQAANFSWFNMSAHLTNYGGGGLIYEKLLPQFPFMPYFELPELGFDYIVHSDNIATNDTKGYKQNEKRMKEYLKAYGLPDEQVAEVIAGVFAFWRQALGIADRFKENNEKCFELTVAEKVKPFRLWKDYYQIAWNNVSFHEIPTETYCDYYYTELDKVCEQHKPAVANYLAMKLLYLMDSKLKSTKFQRDYCLLNMQNSMIFILNKLYLLEYFTDETHAEIDNIIVELRKSLVLLMQNADWIDEETREQALLKESTIDSRIGSFKDNNATHTLIRQINNLTYVPGSYAVNNINLKQFRTRMRRFHGINSKNLSSETKPLELLVGMQVNAFYFNLDNSINVMAGILHPPAYHQDWPNSLKFGTIGYLVGHELTHGFDTTGSLYDSSGEPRNWWTNESSKAFSDRSDCFINHYSKYLIPEINRKVNGNLTKDENIADSGGLREAMSAYRSHMKQLLKNEIDTTGILKQEQMPGMDLSPEQLFFVGFAQLWCAAYEEEHYWEELTDEHAMDKYRVLGAVTNNEDFTQAYNCPLGTPMNPNGSKCRVW